MPNQAMRWGANSAHSFASSDQRRVRSGLELRVAGDVIAMAVRMHDHQRDRSSSMKRRPALEDLVYGRGNVCRLRSRIDEHRTPLPEQQIEKRLLEVRASRLSKDEQIRIVFVDAKRRCFGTRCRRGPRGRQRAALEMFCGGRLQT